MFLRRLWLGGPLGVLVAVLAHVAGFGADHVPGSVHAAELLGVLGATLALLALAVFVRGVASGAIAGVTARSAPPEFARRLRTLAFDSAMLTLVGALAFALIEVCEGHLAVGGSLRAAFALLPVALGVAVLAPRAARSLHAAGSCVGASLAGPQRARNASVVTRAMRRRHGCGRAQLGTLGGRAPPHLA